MSSHTRIGGVIGFAVAVLGGVPAFGSVHLMQIEQVTGAVNGDKTAQAIQLRMRSPGQNFTQGSQIRAWDAAGLNPILIVTAGANVPNGAGGARILIASTNFAAYTTPAAVPDFIMTSLIPASYLAAGSLTFEAPGFGLLWRLSWGGASYTGTGFGGFTNDTDSNFNPPFAGPLPTNCTKAVLFPGTAGAASTNNAADYVLTAGAATFNNNTGTAFVVNTCSLPSDCNDGVACTDDACMGGCCVFTSNNANCPTDGMFCNGSEVCNSATGCVHAGNPCTIPPNVFCDEVFDICGTCGSNPDCNDSVACTDDTCVGGSCVFTPNNAHCPSNGLFCDGTESCHATNNCVSSGDPCPGQECNETTDSCDIFVIAIALELIAGGGQTAANPTLAAPLGITDAGDGTGRLFIHDQNGLIRVLDAGGTLLKEPMLDLTAPGRMPSLGIDFGDFPIFDERGLLGLAFHPDFETNGKFYIQYSKPRTSTGSEPCDLDIPPGVCHEEVVAQYTMLCDPVCHPLTQNVADASSEVIIFRWDKPQWNHNAGHIAFDPEGFLYISTGDGGGAHDGLCDSPPSHGNPPTNGPGGNGQNIESKLGKMIRIDVDSSPLTTAGWIENPANGHWYRLTAPGTWKEAEAEAVAQGGHLVTVNDAQEQLWLYDNFPNAVLPIWIGLYQLPDSAEPGDGWVWISGEPTTYFNWGSGEPNDGAIHGPHYEQFAETNHACGEGGCGAPGFWNDAIPNGPQTGIIERGTAYDIPADNPFVGMAGLDEIYAYGFRNPFRFSFDDGLGGDDALYLADVGQDIYEEVDKVVKGGNYGWAIREGAHCFDPCPPRTPLPGCTGPGLIDPISEYTHPEGGTAVIGGYVYRGAAYPQLQGKYVYGDDASDFFSPSGRLYYFDLTGPEAFVRKEFFIAPSGAPLGKFVKGFGRDADGELYVAASGVLGPGGTTGVIYKIVPPPANVIVWDPATSGPTMMGTTCTGPLGPWPNCNPLATTRSLRFRVTGEPEPSKLEAIKVTMVDLQNPIPPNQPGNSPPNFGAFESATCTGDPVCTTPLTCTLPSNGCARWVGKLGTFLEYQGDGAAGGTFRAARLQCTPYYWDWKPEGLIAVVGAEIAPSSEYSVQVYGASCTGVEAACSNVSSAVTMYTRRSGDAGPNFNPPATTDQPDALDIAAVVNKLKSVPGSLVEEITQMRPNLVELNADINALDIAAVVDGVKFGKYGFSGPCPCPSTVTCNFTGCTSDSTCAGIYGAESTCVKTCVGGTNASDPCINDTHCPGSTCGAGFCRDRCGRCKP